jgi:hypothetical protein
MDEEVLAGYTGWFNESVIQDLGNRPEVTLSFGSY